MEGLRHVIHQALPNSLRSAAGVSTASAWPAAVLRLLEASEAGLPTTSTAPGPQVASCHGCSSAQRSDTSASAPSTSGRRLGQLWTLSMPTATAAASLSQHTGSITPFHHQPSRSGSESRPHSTRSFASKTQVEYIPLPGPEFDAYTSTPSNPMQLLTAIGHARSLDRLEELTGPDLLPRFDAVHVAAALTRLPKLVRYRDQDLTDTGVVYPPDSGLRAIRPRPGALPRRGHVERAGALALQLCELLPGATPSLYPRQVANCIWALGTLHSAGIPVTVPQPQDLARRSQVAATGVGLGAGGDGGGGGPETAPGATPKAGSLEHLEQMMQRHMSSAFSKAYISLLGVTARDGYAFMRTHIQPLEVCQLLKGMSLLPRACMHYETVHELTRWIAQHAQQLDARVLGMALRSLLALRDAHWKLEGAEALAAALTAAAPRIVALKQDFAPVGIAGVMWAYGQAAGLLRGPQALDRELVHQLFSELAEGVAPQIVMVNPTDIYMMLIGCSLQQYRDADLLHLLGNKAVQLLESFQPSELASALQSMAELRSPNAALLTATVRSAMAESEISPDLGLWVVSRVTYAYATGGIEAMAAQAEAQEQGQEEGRGGGEGWSPETAREQAFAMLRRMRQPLAAALAEGRQRAKPEDLGRMAWALGAIRQQQAAVGVTAGEQDDAELMQALADAGEACVPGCTLPQLAALMVALHGLQFNASMLLAAASNQARALAGHAAERGPREAAALLRHAEDVLHVCDAHGVNDPDLAKAVAGLLLSATSSQGAWAHAGSPPPARLLRLLLACHRMNAAKPALRGAVATLLATQPLLPAPGAAHPAPGGASVRPGMAVEPGLLAQAITAYADLASQQQQRVAAAAAAEAAAAGAAAKAPGAGASVTPSAAPAAAALSAATAATAAASAALQSDMQALQALAKALLQASPQQLTVLEQRALDAALGQARALAGSGGADAAQLAGVFGDLQRWLAG